jgi:hypothetical protein
MPGKPGSNKSVPQRMTERLPKLIRLFLLKLFAFRSSFRNITAVRYLTVPSYRLTKEFIYHCNYFRKKLSMSMLNTMKECLTQGSSSTVDGFVHKVHVLRVPQCMSPRWN